jgi:hypothetical protein
VAEEKKPRHPLHDIMDMVTGRAKESEKASWPVTLILLAGLVITISILGLRLAMSKRKAAELAVKVRRAEEEKKRVVEAKELEENAHTREALEKKSQDITGKILGIKAQMALRMQKHKEAADGLRSVTSWDEVVVFDARGDK